MPGLVVALWARDQPTSDRLLPTALSLRAAAAAAGTADTIVVAGAPDGVDVATLADTRTTAPDHVAFLNQLIAAGERHLAVALDAIVVPPGWADRALEWLDDDMRIASVSFLSNAPGPLCFPWRDLPANHHVEQMDEVTITRRLRHERRASRPTRISWGAGPLVVLGGAALEAVGPLATPPDGDAAAAIADWCARARHRGFADILDTTTFVTWPRDVAARREPFGDASPWLTARHPQLVAVDADDRTRPDSALAIGHGAARARVLGLRVLVDGRCLGPVEMGTQVQALQVIGALSAHDDVQSVAVMLATDIPPYAKDVLAFDKVDARRTDRLDAFGPVDVIHRPYQPDQFFDAVAWSATPARLVVTVQDLIAYEGASYHRDATDWAAYRDGLRAGVHHADAVVVFADDVRERLLDAALPVELERLFVVANGTDHLGGDEPATMPAELSARGFAAEEFVVCLGANYAHKHRDLAIRVVDELSRRGRDLTLVLAGAAVPSGSSRVAEAEALGAMPPAARRGVVTIPDVTKGERNWLLRHASAVLYPTANEGFGLVPFEAARFGTPTVAVTFGPIREILGDVPVAADSWSPAAFADAVERLLADPALARAQVDAVLDTGASYPWASTGSGLVAAYYDVMARPRRRAT